jgi:thymidylate synthase
MRQGFPLLTTKKVYWSGVLRELLWFLRGETDANILKAKNVHIWDGNSSRRALDGLGLTGYNEGECGPIYGYQWRHWNAPYPLGSGHMGIDQLTAIINEIKTNPTSRRLFMTAWNPEQLSQMCLPPCHVSYQFYVDADRLSVHLYQRSADVFLGLPFNIASTATLLHIIAGLTGYKAGRVIISLGDVHIYDEHLDAVRQQLKNKPLPFCKLVVRTRERLEDYEESDFELVGYHSAEPIKAVMVA